MKTFVLASLIAATAATGCTTEDAHVGATWTVRTLSNPDIGCPPGITTAALYNQPVDINGDAVGQPIIDLFDCADGAGTSAPLPPDTYETWIDLTNDNNTQKYASSTPAFLDVRAVDLTYSAEIFDDAGYFQLSWDLVGGQSGAPLTCADAGIDNPNNSGVEITATLSGTSAAGTDQFNCTDHFGITDALAAGDYTISIDAFTDAGGAIGTVPTIQDTIHAPNVITDLGPVTIPIDNL